MDKDTRNSLEKVMVASINDDVIADIKNNLTEFGVSVTWSGPIDGAIQAILSGHLSEALVLDVDNIGTQSSTAIRAWNKCKMRLKDGSVTLPPIVLSCSPESVSTALLYRSIGANEIAVRPCVGKNLLYRILMSKYPVNSIPIVECDSQIITIDTAPIDSADDEINREINELKSKIASQKDQNLLLKRQLDDFIWRHLRAARWPTIPVMKNLKEEDNKLGPYEMTQYLGQGGFGYVRAAINTETGIKVAIKQLSKESIKSFDDIESVEAEAKSMITLTHPNIVRLLAIEHTQQYIYIILEYLGGGDLYHYLKENGALKEDEIRRILFPILQALEYCHNRRICHRDIKPENILFDDDLNPKLTDFGLSCLNKPGSSVKTFCGSPGYTAPEVIMKEPYDGLSADIYSLGCMVLDMCTGLGRDLRISSRLSPEEMQTKIEDFSKDSHLSRYSPNLVDFLSKMLHFDKKQRLSANHLLRHPFITSKQSSTPSNKFNASLSTSFKSSTTLTRSRRIVVNPSGDSESHDSNNDISKLTKEDSDPLLNSNTNNSDNNNSGNNN